jgi:DNA-binding PadR family transcriptional regulator
VVVERRLTVTDYAVLGMLGHVGRPISGYEIRKSIASSIGYIWEPSKTQLYAVLPRLVRAGLTTGRLIEQRDRPNKHVYRISRRGRSVLTRWLREQEDFGNLDQALDVTLLKVFFSRQGDPGAVAAQIAALRDAHAARLDVYLKMAETPLRQPDDGSARLTLRLGILRASAFLAWADAAISELER